MNRHSQESISIALGIPEAIISGDNIPQPPGFG